MEDHAIQSGFKAYATIARKNGAAKNRRRNKIRPPSRLRGIAPVCRARRRKKLDMPNAAIRMKAKEYRKTSMLCTSIRIQPSVVSYQLSVISSKLSVIVISYRCQQSAIHS
jgi:hypothetical protein